MSASTPNAADRRHTDNAPRDCGDCNVCCTAMRVAPIDKPAGARCAHQGPAGCGIYHERPNVCREWYCMWVRDFGKVFSEDQRPDILGVFFTARLNPEGPGQIIYAHEIGPDSSKRAAAIEAVDYLRQFAPVHIIRHRPSHAVHTPPRTMLTFNGREVA